NPHPARTISSPVTRSPGVAIVAIDPGAGNVEAVVVGRRQQRLSLQRSRRLGRITIFGLLSGAPESWNPAPALGRLRPVARDVLTAGRSVAVGAADPSEAVLIGIPGPVSRKRLHVVAFRPQSRRLLGNGLVRLLRGAAG